VAIYLALDELPVLALPDNGRIVGINATAAGLQAAGLTAAAGYTGNRVRSIDDSDAAVWTNDCEPGWYLKGGAVQAERPLTDAQQVAVDVASLQASVNREVADLEELLARERIAPHVDSGHAWSDDLLHALIKPNIRLLDVLLRAAKASPSATTIAAYRTTLDNFNALALTLGLLGLADQATKSVWRPKRDGAFAYGYDAATGGVRQHNDQDVRFAVAYPDGETVVTWDAIAAVNAL